uniref:hypothetical protein n=2 Tax=Serratia TaxID=613 RepID=UPI001F4C30BE|nr:hypothetical protein [Serratia proteamaculans]
MLGVFMRFIDSNIISEIFKFSNNSRWYGNVHSLSQGRECVPIELNKRKMIVEFVSPPYYRDCNEFMKGISISKIKYRFISVWYGGESPLDGFTELCMLNKDVFCYNSQFFAELLQLAVKTYIDINREVTHYFYESDSSFNNFIVNDVLRDDEKEVKKSETNPIKEVIPPYYGFSIH